MGERREYCVSKMRCWKLMQTTVAEQKLEQEEQVAKAMKECQIVIEAER